MGIVRRTLVIAAAGLAAASLQSAGAAPDATWSARSIAPPAADVEALPGGLFRATTEGGYTFTTHGGDPADGHGPSIGPGDPERDPVCATGHVQHVLYGYAPLLGNRIDDVREDIRAQIRRINAVLNESALESGNTTADFKVACDDAG
ncbi:MAG TPA: hypothetical protein VHI71_05410, partial [Actinomycetota bacterium]|nr:hypothetical protein [Actinomycetota bacterium]